MGNHHSDGSQVEVFHAAGLEGWAAIRRDLSVTERDRLARFVNEADRARSALAAWLLREAVARRLGGQSSEVLVDRACPWCGEQHGRPRVPGSDIHASVAHSGAHVVVALAAEPVGVDVEALGVPHARRGTAALEALATCLLAPGEDAPRTHRELLVTWTRKEALVKLTGEGLRQPLTTIRLTPPWERPALLHVPRRLRHVELVDLTLDPEVVSAIAVTPGRSIRVHRVKVPARSTKERLLGTDVEAAVS